MKCAPWALLLSSVLFSISCEQSNSLTAARPTGTAGAWFVVAVNSNPMFPSSSGFVAVAPEGEAQLSYSDILSWLDAGECGVLESTDVSIPSEAIADPIVFRDPTGATWPASPYEYNNFGTVYATETIPGAPLGAWSASVGNAWQEEVPLPSSVSVSPAAFDGTDVLYASQGPIELRVTPATSDAYIDIPLTTDASATSSGWLVCRMKSDGTFVLDESQLSEVDMGDFGTMIELFVLSSSTRQYDGRKATLEGALVYHAPLLP